MRGLVTASLLLLLGPGCGAPEAARETPRTHADAPARPAKAPPAPTPSASVTDAPTADAASEPAAAAPAGDAGTPTARVFSRDLQVQGGLSPLVVRRVLRANAAQVKHCYEQALAQEPGLGGSLDLVFVISASGEVTEASIARSTLGNPSADACIASAARRWSFPAPDGGGVVRVVHPIELTTPGRAPAAPPGTIDWTLELQPARATMATRARVTVRIRATNRGPRTVDPGHHALDFTVDGVSSMELNMAFGNGGMERSWTALSAGATARDERTGMELVDAPGRHLIVMSHPDGPELARAVLTVR